MPRDFDRVDKIRFNPDGVKAPGPKVDMAVIVKTFDPVAPPDFSDGSRRPSAPIIWHSLLIRATGH